MHFLKVNERYKIIFYTFLCKKYPISSEEIPISYTEMPISSEEININVAEMIEKGTEKAETHADFRSFL